MQLDQQKELKSLWDDKAGWESEREQRNPRKQVHTDLLWREIRQSIGEDCRQKILDAGAGTGRFSIPLAKAGHRVTHLDISEKMLAKAMKESRANGISGLNFVLGSIDDLSQFTDNYFDCVLCLDSPLSFCYSNYEKALSELVRVARSKLILCVINCLGIISEGGIEFDLIHFGKPNTVWQVYRSGTLVATKELKELQSTIFSWHSFKPVEIKHLVEAMGCEVDRISAPGTLARFVNTDMLKELCEDKEAYKSYLDFEEEYDKNDGVLGVGAVGAGGLLVTARKIMMQ